jgi:RHS repeat-associated protein
MARRSAEDALFYTMNSAECPAVPTHNGSTPTGSTRFTMLQNYRYDLYGTPSYFNSTSQPLNSSTVGVADLYAGERWIPELSLYDLRNRFMSPELGRFLQPDPIGFQGDASNLYRYCGNDPIDKSDPMGLENPPAQVVGGSFWAMEKFFDSFCTFQGDFNQFLTGIRPQAGMDGGGGGLKEAGGAPGGEGNKSMSSDGIAVTGGFTSRREMEDNAVAKDYAQIDKSAIGRKDRPEYGGLSLERKDAHGRTEYGFTGPYKGQQGRVEDKYRKMREANFLVVHGPGSLPVPAGWTKNGWHYAHVIPGNTIPADDKAVARDHHYHVVGAAPPLKRTIYYNPGKPMVEYYP